MKHHATGDAHLLTENPKQLLSKEAQENLGVFEYFCMQTAKLLSLTAEVFLRRNFGQRYMGTVNFSLSIFIFFSIMMTSITAHFVTGGEASLMLMLYGCAFMIAGTMHFVAIVRRSMHGVQWHTRYSGTPLSFWSKLPWPFPFALQEHIIKCFHEPILVALISCVVMLFDTTFGIFLRLVAFSLFMRANLDLIHQKRKVLDALDARIDSEEFEKSVVEARQPSECRGSRFAGIVRPGIKEEQAAMLAAYGAERLDSKLQSMMKSKAEDGENDPESEHAE